ncbi:MAG: hypothetical protein GX112_02535 [Clostridiaceae bacterium]|nr:hypothetical protein [Clostridiaceae bacterium]
MFELRNQHLTVRFDEQGRLTWLENNQTGHGNRIDTPAESFKLVFQQGENWEHVAFGDRQSYEIVQGDGKIDFIVASVQTPTGPAAIKVVLSARLQGEDLVFDASIDNRTDALVTDFEYPRVGVIKSLAGGKPALLWPHQSGEKVSNIGQVLSAMPYGREESSTLAITYPGPASMQWMALTEKDQTLYLGVHDPDCMASELRAAGDAEDTGAITLSFNRFAFVKQDETWPSPPAVLKLYTGSWHRGADDYKTWSATWRPHHDKPQWIQDMLGYFLVINKQQYGHEMWPYDTLPELYERALAHGCDALGLFGWYHSGHDNQYPDLEVSETLGGADQLKANIQAVQQAGGHVTLYFQGHLIDVNTDYYKNGGHRFESKSSWGVPYYEQYNKYHNSHFLKRFTRKTFSNACPACPEWQQLMRDKAHFVAQFGPDGVLYDQIGGMPPYPCFDDSHPHKHGKPSLSISQGRYQLLDGIQKETKKIDPEFAFMTEHITDLYSAFVDALHGINSRPSRAGDRQASLLDEAHCETLNYPELFRYCFPDVIITVRNPAPYITQRFANYAFTFGFRYEMELRYLADCEEIKADKWPERRAYAAAVSALRRRYWQVLGHGEFIDELGLVNQNQAVIAKAYTGDDQVLVACWNDTEQAQALSLSVPGYTFSEWADTDTTEAALPATIGAGRIGLAVFTRS